MPAINNMPRLILMPNNIPSAIPSKAECASCHNKIDPYGFALEQYDPIGRLKKRDQNTSTTLWNGLSIDGAADLREFLCHIKVL